MGCASNIDGVMGRIVAAERAVTVGTVAGVNEAAAVFTAAIRAEIGRAAPGGFMRGVGRQGAKVGVGFKPATQPVHPTALVHARGPLHLLERRNVAHVIVARRAKVLSIGQDQFAKSVLHPGSDGKHPFERGKILSTPAANAALARSVVAQVDQAMR